MKPAFTIIEMLVVIGIFAVLMGLTVGSFASSKRGDKLLATEHLISDMVRQARHTARSSGAPVEILIEKADKSQGRRNGRVQGVSQIPVWIEDFDGSGGTAGNAPGSTGQGLQVPPAPGGSGSTRILAANEALTRSSRSSGFYISCQVLPPLISTPGVLVVPLIVIGSSTNRRDSLGGLELKLQSFPLQDVLAGDAQNGGSGERAMLKTWEIIGWLGNGTDLPIEISSLASEDQPADVDRDEQPLHPSVAGSTHPNDVATPLAGGRWVEIGMLFEPSADDWRLVLYRDGLRIAERRFNTSPAPVRGSETITVGEVEVTDSSGTTPYLASLALIDNVRIARLASANPAPLPGDMEPDLEYRIVAHPDGRVELNQAAKLAGAADHAAAAAETVKDGVMGFTGTFSSIGKATITVTVDGRVSSAMVPQ